MYHEHGALLNSNRMIFSVRRAAVEMTLLCPRSGRTARRIYYTTPEQKEIALASREAEQKKYTKWVASEKTILDRPGEIAFPSQICFCWDESGVSYWHRNPIRRPFASPFHPYSETYCVGD